MRFLGILAVTMLFSHIDYLPCVAKELPKIKEGTRVRIKAPDTFNGWLVGNVVGINDKVIILNSQARDQFMPISLASITRFEKGLGKKSRTSMVGKSAGVGFLIGAGMSFLMGIAIDPADSDYEISRGVSGLICGIIGGVAGLPVGALFGAVSSKSERWERVPLEHIRVSILPQHQGGLTFAASFEF